MRILLVEDDQQLAEAVVEVLRSHRYVVDVEHDGQKAWEFIEALDYDLLLLDIMLPSLDGISLCQQLRSAGYSLPILLLTAHDTETDVIRGLDAGADDCVLVKPFNPQALLARIRALLRRHIPPTPPVLRWERCELNPSSCEVTYDGQLLPLTPKEYLLLELFLHNGNRVFSRSAILEHLWSIEDTPTEDTVRAHVKGLRQKLKSAGAPEDLIETVYGLGYRLKPLPDESPDRQTLSESTSRTVAAVNQVWQRFKKKIISRLTILEKATTAQREGTLDNQLRSSAISEAHKLVGSLGTFSFVEGSELARKIEDQLRRAESANQQQAQQLAQLVAALRQQLQRTDADQTSAKPTRSEDATAMERTRTASHSHRERYPLSPPLEYANAPFTPQTATVNEPPLLLVVDDDAELGEGLAIEATRWGMRAEIVTTFLAARELLYRELPSAVLLDLGFPGQADAGLEFLDELTHSFPSLPIVVFTAWNNLANRVEVVRRGGCAFFPKPMPPEQVLEYVTQILQRVSTSEGKVLVVDDDPEVLASLRTLLEPWGLRLFTLEDPRHFWKRLEKSAPDLLILDVAMPHLSGIELCQVVRNDPHWEELPVLVLTAHTDANTVCQLFTAGADDYVSKPIVGPELINRIFNRLERSRLLHSLAETDALTGVANRRKSTQELNQYLLLAERYRQPMSVALLDIDQFKQVNNRYGHAVGDQVLSRLGELLRHTFGSNDVVARWGGEEFVIGMYGTNRENAVMRVTQLLKTLRRQVFTGSSNPTPFQMTFSVGVAQYPEDGCDLQILYQAANAALERAKAAGCNRVLSTR